MTVSSDRIFENGVLQTTYELRAPLVIAFVLANVLAQYLERFGFELAGEALVVLVSLPLFVVGVGLLREVGHWMRKRQSAL